jgi:hypothetical protein
MLETGWEFMSLVFADDDDIGLPELQSQIAQAVGNLGDGPI